MRCTQCQAKTRVTHTYMSQNIRTADRVCTKCGYTFATVTMLATRLGLPEVSGYRLAKYLDSNKLGSDDDVGPVGIESDLDGGEGL